MDAFKRQGMGARRGEFNTCADTVAGFLRRGVHPREL